MRKALTEVALICFLLAIVVNGRTQTNYDTNNGKYIAFITNGDIFDGGWNSVVNAGRVQMEAALNMSGSLWVGGILNNQMALEAIKSLVPRGFRLIISSTSEHVNAFEVAAALYPNITFVRYTTLSGLPNLSDVTWSNAEQLYCMGAICGAIATNGKVGFIHPGINGEGSIVSINAFYSGVKFANPNATVYTFYTGSYEAPDRATGAARILIDEIGCDSITGQQNDLSVPEAAIAGGLLAIGTSGYSLRTLYGENVAVSFVRDWSSALIKYAVAANGTIFKSDITGNFQNGGQGVDKPSHFVTAEQWAILQTSLNEFKSGKLAYNCNPWVSEFDLNTTTGCLTSKGKTQLASKVLSNIVQLGYYNVPLTTIEFPKQIATGIISACAVLLIFLLALAVFVALMRNNSIIRSASPFFMELILLGCTMVYVGAITWMIEPSVNICYARIWVPSLGATVAIGALIAKNVRIWLIFANTKLYASNHLVLMRNFLGGVIALIVLNLVILIVYVGIGPKGVAVLQGVDGLGKYEIRNVCASSKKGDSVIIAILAFHLAQLAFGCFLSFKLRIIEQMDTTQFEDYSERKIVEASNYIVTAMLALVVAFTGVVGTSPVVLPVAVATGLILCNTPLLLIIFGSRIMNLIYKGGQEHPIIGAVKTASTKGPSSTSKDSSGSKDSKDTSSATATVTQI